FRSGAPDDAQFLRRIPRRISQSRDSRCARIGRLLSHRRPRRPTFLARQRRSVFHPRSTADSASGGAPRIRSAPTVSAEPKLAAVIGWPVHHSVSPVMHSFWLKQHGLKGAYVALPIAPENVARCVEDLPLMGFAGANVTGPHKEAAFALARVLDEDAKATGAVNTLVFEDGGIRGLNTDVRGFASSLSETFGSEVVRSGPATVLGAGGAARAIVHALIRAGAPEIRLVNRTKSRADTLASQSQDGRVKVLPWNEWAAVSRDTSLLVNTTSLGMKGKPSLELSLDSLA